MGAVVTLAVAEASDVVRELEAVVDPGMEAQALGYLGLAD